jgi:alpha-L-fucosidase
MDAKLGIFIHWGPYSVPAWGPKDRYAEWYSARIYREETAYHDYHVETYGPLSEFGYADFIPMFKAEHWDPDRWARLFKEAGARYIMPVAEHHDGFAMWDSDLTQWDAADMGPKRDIIGELEKAVRRRGMKYTPSYHRAQLWWHYRYKENWDTTRPDRAGLYLKPHSHKEPPSEQFLKEWQARWEELRDKYQPDMMWFDYRWREKAFWPRAKQMMADYYNVAANEWGKEVAITNKTVLYPTRFPLEVGDLVEFDYMKMKTISRLYWQNPRGMGRSFGYNQNEAVEDYATADELIDEFVDIVSKNGNLLLNVGPKANGIIPKLQRDRLHAIGDWLDVNGEAIYGTRPWRIPAEDNIRFTQKDGFLYAIVQDWPGRVLKIHALSELSERLPETISHIRMLGVDEPLSFNRSVRHLRIEMPRQKPCDHAFTLEIAIE